MIIYPAFFILPGMFLLFGATSSSHIAWLFLIVIPAVFLPAALGHLRLLVISTIGVLVARLLLNDIGVVTAGLHIVATLLLMVGAAARCPRCSMHIATREQRWRGGPSAQWCYICGRSRRRVWPFQYVLKPETWDGEYHDDGGGPSSVDSIVDWQRDLMFRRWQKFHRR